MYHRIADPESDIWSIAVSPDNFEQHLKMLQKTGNVVPLDLLAEGINSHSMPRNSIAITFDDGYNDNFTVARPLLEKYNLPATFFITSGNLGGKKEFWWDDLEYHLLFAQRLPAFFSLLINDQLIESELQEETFLTEEIRKKHISWDACIEEPPTKRAALFFKLWQHLKVLPDIAQQQYLEKIKNWTALQISTRQECASMSVSDLKQLVENNLFTIGAHTVNHPALAYHSPEFQKKEMLENRKFLQEITGQEINLIAYPYGNYNEDTLMMAADAKFEAAFTTEEKVVQAQSLKYNLGRFQVKNWNGNELGKFLKSCFNNY